MALVRNRILRGAIAQSNEVNGYFQYNQSDESVTFTPIEQTPAFEVAFEKFADGKFGWNYSGDSSKVGVFNSLLGQSQVFPRVQKDTDYPIEIHIENQLGVPTDMDVYLFLKIQIFN